MGGAGLGRGVTNEPAIGHDHPVADSGLGYYSPGMGWIIFQLVPEPVDEYTEILGLGPILRPPDVLQEHSMGDNLAGIPYEVRQDVILPRLSRGLASFFRTYAQRNPALGLQP